MSAGTVTVAGDGTVSKNGMAEAIFDAMLDIVADAGGTVPVGPEGKKMKDGMASFANRMAGAIVPYITSNAELSGITTIATSGTSGLQRDPVSPFNACLAPNTEKTLPVTGNVL